MSASIQQLTFAVTMVVAALQAGSAAGNLLTNGGFETPVLPEDSYLTIGMGGEPFGWQVTMGDIDIVRLLLTSLNIHFSAFEGNQILDLNGFTRGAVRQDFPAISGKPYLLAADSFPRID